MKGNTLPSGQAGQLALGTPGAVAVLPPCTSGASPPLALPDCPFGLPLPAPPALAPAWALTAPPCASPPPAPECGLEQARTTNARAHVNSRLCHSRPLRASPRLFSASPTARTLPLGEPSSPLAGTERRRSLPIRGRH